MTNSMLDILDVHVCTITNLSFNGGHLVCPWITATESSLLWLSYELSLHCGGQKTVITRKKKIRKEAITVVETVATRKGKKRHSQENKKTKKKIEL